MRGGVGKSLTWIHLSDLHFGHGNEAPGRFDQKLVTRKIIEDATMVASELGPPDVVFVTGDIAFSASTDKEYPVAKLWLDELLGALSIGPDRVLLVPGNHDVDRKKAVEGLARNVHKLARTNPKEVDALLQNAVEMETIWPKLAAYQKFARAYGSPEIRPGKPFWTKELPSGLGPIMAIGLNTTLLSFDGGDSPENLALGLDQFQQAQQEAKRDALLFVLQHHPPGWLSDGKDLFALLADWPHILLSGHIHDQNGFIRLPLTSRGHLELVAGAGHQDAKEAGNHAYAWGRLTRDGLDYFPRAWFKNGVKFLDQRIDPPKDQEQYTPKLGKYVHVPRTKLPSALEKWLENTPTHAATTPSVDAITGPAPFAPPIAVPAPAPANPVIATFDPGRPHVHIPYPRKGDQVVGRSDALLKVREQLVQKRRTAIGHTAAFVGLGGLGKTQLAVEYAHAYKDEYPGGVYWFNADADLDRQLSQLAELARWASPLSEQRYKLEIATQQIRTRSNCLIIFDNVEDLAAIEFLLPESSATPHLLITSRVSQNGFDAVPIERLSEAESLEMLRNESGRSLDKPGDEEAALRIVQQLDGLPLVLELAGAYLRRFANVSWLAYADLLEKEGVKARGIRDGAFASFTKHSANLYATLHIEEAIFKDLPLLREALDLLAWSGSASMSRELLAFLLGTDSAELDVALGEAETLRILKREYETTDPSNARFQMHRLVREVRQAEVPLEHDPARWLPILVRLGDWFHALRDDFANLHPYEAELDHLEVWQSHAAQLGIMREVVRLLWLRAYPHYYRGPYQRANDMVQKALGLFEGAGVTDPEVRATLRNDLGTTLTDLRDHRKALACKQGALDIRLNVLGEKHPDTASLLNNIGVSLDYLGDHLKALEYKQRALDIQLNVLGEKHPDTATSLGSLGFTLDALGDHRKAFAHEQRALDIWLEIRGEKHPDTARAYNNIGYSFEKNGESAKARDHVMKALAIRRDILGDSHPETTSSWKNVVGMLQRQNKKATALGLIESDLKRFPNNSTLRRLKNELLGKRTAKDCGRSSASTKNAKTRKR